MHIEITKQIDAILTIIRAIIDHQGETKFITLIAMVISQLGQVCQENIATHINLQNSVSGPLHAGM